ncbi:hypothetical protein A167_00029 [Alcanivorax sp. S71-1-4]|nr:hypothetical protein A167_00029 [Alcanivorax sp. S71-1-4]
MHGQIGLNPGIRPCGGDAAIAPGSKEVTLIGAGGHWLTAATQQHVLYALADDGATRLSLVFQREHFGIRATSTMADISGENDLFLIQFAVTVQVQTCVDGHATSGTVLPGRLIVQANQRIPTIIPWLAVRAILTTRSVFTISTRQAIAKIGGLLHFLWVQHTVAVQVYPCLDQLATSSAIRTRCFIGNADQGEQAICAVLSISAVIAICAILAVRAIFAVCTVADIEA